MNKKPLAVFGLILLCAIAYYFFPFEQSPKVLSEDDALTALLEEYPDLNAYFTTDLPPSSMASERAPLGWRFGFIRRGSGVPGILDARCFLVDDSAEVSSLGEYQRGASGEVEVINLETCKPFGGVTLGKCYVGGCSGQICADEPGAMSTCEYREEYACYKSASCERQPSGECGWTETAELISCLKSPSSI